MQLFSQSRTLFGLGFLGCLLLMGVAFYLQYFMGLEPCPLCYVQRVIVIAFGVISLLAALHNPAAIGRKVYAFLLVLIAGSGIAAAGRQIWLQQLPKDQLPACLPSLEFMLEAFPLQEVIAKMLHGSSDCAEVTWTFFGFSIAELSMLGFIMMLLWSLMLLLKRFTRKSIFR